MSAEPRTRIDLSHTVEDGMTTYPGLPVPIVCDYLTRERSRTIYAEGTEFQIGVITMCSNTGTYIDSPFHRYPDGIDLSELPLEQIAEVEAVVVDGGGSVDVDSFTGVEIAGKAVLVRTGWQRHWGTPEYLTGHPFLTAAAARHLVDSGAVLVGIDSLNIDDTSTATAGARPVHSTLLAAGIPICEHLADLSMLPREGFRFSAVPVKIRGMGTFPVRAYATV